LGRACRRTDEVDEAPLYKEPHARLSRAGLRGREGDPVYAIGGCFPVVGPPVCLLNITAFGDWLVVLRLYMKSLWK
jgi:hypothetical protein